MNLRRSSIGKGDTNFERPKSDTYVTPVVEEKFAGSRFLVGGAVPVHEIQAEAIMRGTACLRVAIHSGKARRAALQRPFAGRRGRITSCKRFRQWGTLSILKRSALSSSATPRVAGRVSRDLRRRQALTTLCIHRPASRSRLLVESDEN